MQVGSHMSDKLCLYSLRTLLTFWLSPITLSVFSSLTDPMGRQVLHTGFVVQTWSWLHYQDGIDSVYCHTCCKVLKTKKVSVGKGSWEPSFTVKGFNNCKDATSLLKKHQDSERSASALQRIKTYLQTSMTQLRMDNLTVLHVHKENLDVKFSKRLCISAWT